jgi:uncharacterized membrane protein
MYPRIRSISYPLLLILSSVIGLVAAFALTIEKLNKLANPDALSACDYSLLVQCSANLNSWQGSLFGFPNPLLGIVGWSMALVVGVALISGVKFPRLFLQLFNVGLFAALLLVIWLIYISIFLLGTLCPWCMVTWLATIPAFLLGTFWNMKQGVWGEKLSIAGNNLFFWSPTLIIFAYLIPAIIAQVRLDWINRAFLLLF